MFDESRPIFQQLADRLAHDILLGTYAEAEQVLQEMIDTGTSQIENSDLRAYSGVGAPTPMPFEYDIVKINTVNGHVLRAYGLLGLGHREQALQEIEAV